MKTNLIIIALLLTSVFAFGQEKKSEEPSKTEKPSVILFKTTVYDFGNIEFGSDATAVYEFKNVTRKPVKLSNVKTSCGCTAADWPKEEIAKKKKQKITVTYDSRRVGKFNKTIYVYVEGLENPIQLEIQGEVMPQTTEQQNNTDIKTGKSVEPKKVTDHKIKTVDSKSTQLKEKSNK